MMQIGLSTASYFHRMPVEDAVTDIAAHGVPVAEVFLNTFSEYEAAFAAPLAARVKDGGLSVYSLHTMTTNFEPQLFSVESRQRDDAWRLFERALTAGKLLGATHYVMHGPANLAGMTTTRHIPRIAPVLKDLAALSAAYGMRLTLENVSWCMFSTPEFGAELIDRLGRGVLGFTLDVKQAFRCRRTPSEFLCVMGEDLCNVHLCDVAVGADGSVSPKMPGKGTFRFDELRDELARIGYAGPAFLEVYSDMYGAISELYDGVEYLNRVFNPGA